MMRRWPSIAAAVAAGLVPAHALAWGYEGHEVVATIARGLLTPPVRARVDQMLAADTGNALSGHDMASEATWADRFRSAGHSETGDWHFVDLELDGGDLQAACYGFPSGPPEASKWPAKDCVVDKLEEFAKELGAPSTSPEERLLALEFVLHFVGDLHQPLHAADNHDLGGNCVQLAMGGPRTVNLHSFWDTGVVQGLGPNADAVAASLAARITPGQRADWARGDFRAWAAESYAVAKAKVYVIGSRPGCEGQTPVTFPAGYAEAAQATAATQLQKAGVRLAATLNKALADKP